MVVPRQKSKKIEMTTGAMKASVVRPLPEIDNRAPRTIVILSTLSLAYEGLPVLVLKEGHGFHDRVAGTRVARREVEACPTTP